jgi:hypothetical protein
MSGVPPDAFRKILESGAHSDFSITCRDATFKVHKVIIAAASEFFKVACQGGFKVILHQIEILWQNTHYI